jgi:hypothetical protein
MATSSSTFAVTLMVVSGLSLLLSNLVIQPLWRSSCVQNTLPFLPVFSEEKYRASFTMLNVLFGVVFLVGLGLYVAPTVAEKVKNVPLVGPAVGAAVAPLGHQSEYASYMF